MKQVPSSFCFYLVSETGERFEPVTYTAQGDEDIGEMFNMALIEYTHMIYNKYEKHPKPMQITDELQASFDSYTLLYLRTKVNTS
jgi:hypothetical protein